MPVTPICSWGDVEDLARLGLGLQGSKLGHQLVVHVKPPGRVHEHEVVPQRGRLLESRSQDLQWAVAGG